jgi:hypothetical protein
MRVCFSCGTCQISVQKLPVLSEFVRLGATLPVRVMGARRGGGKGVTFSLLASSVNDGLTRGMLSVGMTLAGCVLSVEDRGYSVDTGIEDCRAFVADESVADVDAMNVDERKHALSVGQPLLATVMAAAGARGPVQLSLSSDVVLPASEQAVFRALRAGARVLATVAAHVVNGVVVRFCGYLVGTIASEHIDGELPDVDTEVCACVRACRVRCSLEVVRSCKLGCCSSMPRAGAWRSRRCRISSH